MFELFKNSRPVSIRARLWWNRIIFNKVKVERCDLKRECEKGDRWMEEFEYIFGFSDRKNKFIGVCRVIRKV